LLWTVVGVLGAGVVVCVIGLFLSSPDRTWEVIIYAGGLLSATGTSFLVVGLFTRRRRVVFDAEGAIAELERLNRSLFRDEPPPKELRRELEDAVRRAERQRRTLIEAEALDQARDLIYAISTARDFLAKHPARRELP